VIVVDNRRRLVEQARAAGHCEFGLKPFISAPETVYCEVLG
jgi:hypothetical protein